MKKPFNGLNALVRNNLQQEPISGNGYIFMNCSKTMLSVINFEMHGYCIWHHFLASSAVTQLYTPIEYTSMIKVVNVGHASLPMYINLSQHRVSERCGFNPSVTFEIPSKL